MRHKFEFEFENYCNYSKPSEMKFFPWFFATVLKP